MTTWMLMHILLPGTGNIMCLIDTKNKIFRGQKAPEKLH